MGGVGGDRKQVPRSGNDKRTESRFPVRGVTKRRGSWCPVRGLAKKENGLRLLRLEKLLSDGDVGAS